MQSIIALFVLVVLVAVSARSPRIPGIPRVLSNSDSVANSVHNYALEKAFSLDDKVVSSKIVRASKSNMLGFSSSDSYKYDILSEVTYANGSCHLKRFGVVTKAGKDFELTDNDLLDTVCGKINSD